MKRIALASLIVGTFAQAAFCAETVVLTHGKVPAPTLIDLGPVGDSVGDQRIWHFLGTSQDNVSVMMDLMMTTMALSSDPSGFDSRMTDAVFSFGEGTGDTLLVHGIGPYPKGARTVQASLTLERAIIGGTGKYAGARGTVSSKHLDDGTWQHIFSIE